MLFPEPPLQPPGSARLLGPLVSQDTIHLLHNPFWPRCVLYCVPSRHRFRWASVRMAGSSPKSSSPGTVSSSIS